MGSRVVLIVLLLSLLASGQEMQRESRWLRMSAERLYTFTPVPFGAEWQSSPNQPGSFFRAALAFERAWSGREATLESTRDEYRQVRTSFDRIKLYARLNMNAQEVEIVEAQLARLDAVYGAGP